MRRMKKRKTATMMAAVLFHPDSTGAAFHHHHARDFNTTDLIHCLFSFLHVLHSFGSEHTFTAPPFFPMNITTQPCRHSDKRNEPIKGYLIRRPPMPPPQPSRSFVRPPPHPSEVYLGIENVVVQFQKSPARRELCHTNLLQQPDVMWT